MKRQDRWQDTDTFHFYNANPKNRITEDCVIRALCTGLELPYDQVLMEVAALQCKTGYDCKGNKGIDLYLKSKGWTKMKQPRKWDNTKYTGKEFCEEVACKNTNYIANIGVHHIVAIKNCKVWDIWNSTGGSIGNYWVR